MTDLTDVGEFAALFDDHYPRLHRYLHRRVGPDLADDLASETFAEAIRRRDRYDPRRGAPGPWLYGIAHILLARHRRTERRQLAAYARTGVDPLARAEDDEAVSRADAATQGPALARALAGMSGRDRDVLLLFALADFGYADIAQALAMPVGTVRSKLHRSRRRLRAALGASAGPHDLPLADLNPFPRASSAVTQEMTR